MASDPPSRGSSASASSAPPRRTSPWPWALRAAGLGVVLGVVPWLVAGIPGLLALVPPACGIGAWIGWQLGAAQREITDLRDAAVVRERELLGRAWYARCVLQNAFDAVLIVGSDHRVMDANPAVERLFGTTVDAVSGAPLAELLPELAPDAPRAVRTLASHADGSQFEVDVQIALLAAGPSPDLPWGRARVLAVREVRREGVGAHVLRAAVERHRGREVAEQRRRGHVLGMIGRGIREHTDRLAAELARHPDAPPALAEIGDGLQEQLELLWTLAMWERSGADPTLGPVDLAALVRDAAEDALPVARRRGNVLSVEVDTRVGEVVTDAMLLRCAVRTLLLLAVRGTRDATVRVEAVREAGRGTDWMTVLVDDDRRQPLTPEAREAIQAAFDASEDASPPTDGRAGVALARRLARSLGGHVAVGTHPTLGTSLSLRVPVDPSKVRWASRDRPSTPAA